ncbi:transposase family protein [Streptomyces ferrugineus]|uniref:transposase family protein n=1 Tax=Streptomyces ferrugineus TaxID=1413221 RepID=UPI00389A3EE5
MNPDIRLVIAAARPVPGTTADAHAWRTPGLSQPALRGRLGDGGLPQLPDGGTDRKRPGRPLLPGEEDDNAEHRKVRTRVEHVIGRMNNYKILRDCPQRGDSLHHAVQAVAHMHNLALTS